MALIFSDGCIHDEGKTEPSHVIQTCDSCGYSLMQAPYTSFGGAIPVGPTIINEPVVIQIGKGRSTEDSMIQRRAMNSILLNFPKVKLLDTFEASNYFIFLVYEGNHHIVARKLLDRDGWILFTPGKSAVYCVRETVTLSCNDSTLLSCYFGY